MINIHIMKKYDGRKFATTKARIAPDEGKFPNFPETSYVVQTKRACCLYVTQLTELETTVPPEAARAAVPPDPSWFSTMDLSGH